MLVMHKIKGSSGKKIKTEINSGSNAREKALTIVTLTTQKVTFIFNNYSSSPNGL